MRIASRLAIVALITWLPAVPALAQSWSAAQRLNDPGQTNGDVKEPAISAAADGGFHVTYPTPNQLTTMLGMTHTDFHHLILIVTGASLRGEAADRALAYRLADEINKRLGLDSLWKPLVISDVLYINERGLASQPVISIGGPGVNHLSALFFRELPSVMTIDNTLLIQMDIDLADLRCCLWGMNHEQTVEALELFLDRRYLDRFLEGVTQKSL